MPEVEIWSRVQRMMETSLMMRINGRGTCVIVSLRNLLLSLLCHAVALCVVSFHFVCFDRQFLSSNAFFLDHSYFVAGLACPNGWILPNRTTS